MCMEQTDDAKSWFDKLDIGQVIDMFKRAGVGSIWVKRLGINNNSKQQVYIAGDPSDLSFMPLGNPTYSAPKSQKKKAGSPVIQIPVPWKWLTPQGMYEAPFSKFCYYPQYPEVRFSGFLRGCSEGPSELMGEQKRGHEEGRCLFLGVVRRTDSDFVVGVVVGANSPAARYVLSMDTFVQGKLSPVVYESERGSNEFSVLGNALRSIVMRRIVPWRLKNDNTIAKPYTAPNAPGLTLEAELGVGENAIPGPDFDIWELKAIKQNNLEKRSNHKVTLFTPQPDMGWAAEHPQVDFVRKYGHISGVDEDDNPNEYYFTSSDIAGLTKQENEEKLNLRLVGFTDSRHFDPSGYIGLFDGKTDELAAGWSYLKLLEHWQRKHNRAAYVPYMRESINGETFVEFGPLVTLGISTNFGLFLQAFNDGKVIYDPGDKAALVDGQWKPHSRSQFRINLKDITSIYQEVHEVDIREDNWE